MEASEIRSCERRRVIGERNGERGLEKRSACVVM